MFARCGVVALLSLFSHVADSFTTRGLQLPREVLAREDATYGATESFRHLQKPQQEIPTWVDYNQTISPYGWINDTADANSSILYHMHIPKTAGVSFARDMLATLPSTTGIFSWEGCYPEYLRIFGEEIDAQPAGRGGVVTMLRKPRDHVYSQYKMCFQSEWGQKQMVSFSSDVALMNFSAWLQHFDPVTADDFNCYNPVNMQTRSFSCHAEESHHMYVRADQHAVHLAVENMLKCSFVGILEYYQESLCLLHVMLELQVPNWCNCEDAAAWSSFEQARVEHGTSDDGLPDLSDQDRQVLNKITYHDRLLYKVGLRRFRQDVQAAERRIGVKILC